MYTLVKVGKVGGATEKTNSVNLSKLLAIIDMNSVNCSSGKLFSNKWKQNTLVIKYKFIA